MRQSASERSGARLLRRWRARSARAPSRRGRPPAALALIAAAGFAVAAAAHHSFSDYDMQSERVLEGVVVEFVWKGPHTETLLEVVNPDGSTTRWLLEGMSPSYLGRRGWTNDSLEPGDRVRVTIAPLRNGEPGGTFLRVELADGTEKVMFGAR